jgi:drug/metabolite transporter (DMT)-like permease
MQLNTKQIYCIRSVKLVMLGCVFQSLSLLLSKVLSANFTYPLLVCLRFVLPFCIVLWILVVVKSTHLSFRERPRHVFRAICAVIAQYCLYYYLSQHDLTETVIFLYTGPLYSPFITRLVVKKDFANHIWLGILIGFCGVMLFLNPELNHYWNLDTLIGLGAGFFNSCSQINFQQISRKQPPLCVLFWFYLLTSAASLTLLLISAVFDPDLLSPLSFITSSDILLLLVLFSFVSLSQSLLVARAYQKVKRIASLAPFTFFTTVCVCMIDWFAYQIQPAWSAWIGFMVIIIGAGFALRSLLLFNTQQDLFTNTKITKNST